MDLQVHPLHGGELSARGVNGRLAVPRDGAGNVVVEPRRGPHGVEDRLVLTGGVDEGRPLIRGVGRVLAAHAARGEAGAADDEGQE